MTKIVIQIISGTKISQKLSSSPWHIPDDEDDGSGDALTGRCE